MDINDVVIHINETLDPLGRQNLETQVRSLDGVISARIPDERSHLMIVAYDPEQASTMDVLDAVRTQGLHAQHCGA